MTDENTRGGIDWVDDASIFGAFDNDALQSPTFEPITSNNEICPQHNKHTDTMRESPLDALPLPPSIVGPSDVLPAFGDLNMQIEDGHGMFNLESANLRNRLLVGVNLSEVNYDTRTVHEVTSSTVPNIYRQHWFQPRRSDVIKQPGAQSSSRIEQTTPKAPPNGVPDTY